MTWATEAAMVADFVAWAEHDGWTAYAETAGWDVVLVRETDGFQIGVEAKLTLNAKVLCQVLAHDRFADRHGPDCAAVLVPAAKAVNGLDIIAGRLGIVVITGPTKPGYGFSRHKGVRFSPDLPKLNDRPSPWPDQTWPERCPDQRCQLPDYVPDVGGGHSAPVQLTRWKVAALKAVVVMERCGAITRSDFKALDLSPSRWTQFWLKSDGAGGWTPRPQIPDFNGQHPVNYAEIAADFEKWATAAMKARTLAIQEPAA